MEKASTNFLLTTFASLSYLELNLQEHITEIIVVVITSLIITAIQLGFSKLYQFLKNSNLPEEDKAYILEEAQQVEDKLKEKVEVIRDGNKENTKDNQGPERTTDNPGNEEGNGGNEEGS